MNKIAFLILLFIINFNNLFSQLEASNWNFGKNISLKFDTKGITESSVGNSDFFEGNSTISDKEGNLLLYTDGLTVYNRNKTIMKNGNGFGFDYSNT